MATRDVSAQLNRPNGAPWLGAKVKFRPLDDSYTLAPDESYPISTVVATTDVNGELSVTLAAGLSVAYEVTMPDEETFRIIVPVGSATTLETLRAAYDTTNPEPLPSLEEAVIAVMEDSAEFAAMLEDLVIANGGQPVDAELTALAALTSAADKGIQFTGSGTAATYDLTPAGKALLDDANAAAQLVTLGLSASAAELNTLDGITASTTELNTLDGVTASAAELNTLDGITASTAELNHTDGVTSAIQTQLNAKAADADVVHDTGAETIAGVKTFSSDPIIPDEAYGVGWNGSLEPPTKNAVYDKIETIGSDSGPLYLNPSISTAISATAAESLFDRNFSLPGGTLAVGDELRITAWGETANSSGGTLTFQPRLRIGGVAGVLVATGEVDGVATGTTDTWVIAQTLRVTAIGASGSLYAQMGSYFSATKATVAADPLTRTAPPAAVPSVVNTTTAQVIGATVQHSSAAAGMVSTLHGLTVELLRV